MNHYSTKTHTGKDTEADTDRQVDIHKHRHRETQKPEKCAETDTDNERDRDRHRQRERQRQTLKSKNAFFSRRKQVFGSLYRKNLYNTIKYIFFTGFTKGEEKLTSQETCKSFMGS